MTDLPPLPKHLPWIELAAADGPAYTADQIKAYAAAAVAAEREACAKVVESYCGAWADEGFSLANTIRTRNT